jgi:hypothetical protein
MTWRDLAPADLTDSFRSVWPFPHAVLDGFLAPDRAVALARDFPEPAAMRGGTSYETEHEHAKIGLGDRTRFPPAFRELADELSSAAFLTWLSEATGIDGLVADPLLIGGGLHRMAGDGRLGLHVDFSELMIGGQRYYRRLNLLLFLNLEWQTTWGGALELWESDGHGEWSNRMPKLIVPRLNTCAIFETSHDSWHGVSPLEAPRPRLSWASYYYTAEPPSGYRGLIPSTIFRMRPALA